MIRDTVVFVLVAFVLIVFDEQTQGDSSLTNCSLENEFGHRMNYTCDHGGQCCGDFDEPKCCRTSDLNTTDSRRHTEGHAMTTGEIVGLSLGVMAILGIVISLCKYRHKVTSICRNAGCFGTSSDQNNDVLGNDGEMEELRSPNEET